jgi:hypothetical protein
VGFLNVILPVPLILKVFLAREWVFTFGMKKDFLFTLLVPPHRRRTYGTLWADTRKELS